MKRAGYGMTFLEIMVVCSIVAMCMAVLWPVFIPADSREKICISNMRDIGLAIQMYARDNNSQPPLIETYTVRHNLISWRSSILKYTPGMYCYQCPNNRMKNVKDIEKDGFYRSYALNSCSKTSISRGGPYNRAKRNGPVSEYGNIYNQELTILLVESTAANPNFDILNTSQFSAHPSINTTHGCLSLMHNGKTNFLFADNHVEIMNPISALNREGNNLWTVDNNLFNENEAQVARSSMQAAKDYRKNIVNNIQNEPRIAAK
jgi:prepilin-type processing-associated H-X9-DG protein